MAGIDVRRLDQAFEYTKTTSKYGGLLVARHGWLVYEKYFGRANREVTPNMASCGKTFTSISCGIMLKEKRDEIPEGLETKVFTEKYLPEAFPLSDPRKAEIKLGHLLAMTSGMAEGNMFPGIVRGENVKLDPPPPRDPSLGQDEAALRVRMWTDPGGGYFYSSQGSHVASIVLRHRVGVELQAYIDEKLVKPMGFGGWGYGMIGPGRAGPSLRIRRGEAALPCAPPTRCVLVTFCCARAAGASSSWCLPSTWISVLSPRPTTCTRRSACNSKSTRTGMFSARHATPSSSPERADSAFTLYRH